MSLSSPSYSRAYCRTLSVFESFSDGIERVCTLLSGRNAAFVHTDHKRGEFSCDHRVFKHIASRILLQRLQLSNQRLSVKYWNDSGQFSQNHKSTHFNTAVSVAVEHKGSTAAHLSTHTETCFPSLSRYLTVSAMVVPQAQAKHAAPIDDLRGRTLPVNVQITSGDTEEKAAQLKRAEHHLLPTHPSSVGLISMRWAISFPVICAMATLIANLHRIA